MICGPAKLEAAQTSTIDGVEIINRGYESFTDKLTGLGADIDLNGAGSAMSPLSA